MKAGRKSFSLGLKAVAQSKPRLTYSDCSHAGYPSHRRYYQKVLLNQYRTLRSYTKIIGRHERDILELQQQLTAARDALVSRDHDNSTLRQELRTVHCRLAKRDRAVVLLKADIERVALGAEPETVSSEHSEFLPAEYEVRTVHSI